MSTHFSDFKLNCKEQSREKVKYAQEDYVGRHIGITVLIAWIIIQDKDFLYQPESFKHFLLPICNLAQRVWGQLSYQTPISISLREEINIQ